MARVNKHPNAGLDPSRDLVHGHVALIDILGFKGAWNRFSSQDLIEFFTSIERALTRFKEDSETPSSSLVPIAHLSDSGGIGWKRDDQGVVLLSEIIQYPLPFHYALISDTIVIAFEDQTPDDINGVLHIGAVAARIQRMLFDSRFRWLSRGYICRGQFALNKSIIVGPAIDEAASRYELSDCACIWLSPLLYNDLIEIRSSQWVNSRRKDTDVNAIKEFFFEHGSYLPWINIPLKDGKSIESAVVNPFVRSIPSRCTQILRAFDTSPNDIDVLSKKLRTKDLLQQCHESLCRLFDEPSLDTLPHKKRSKDYKKFYQKMIDRNQARVVRKATFSKEGTRIEDPYEQ
ncbi:hypothetical protein [Fimbriimonas ginsengisoli]|uniref:hypothetical protein n=1 Tax=Fimbriimonas ginsengisoli TaxID=1005039 RepID=UPI00046D5A72|nr:hypothetical protein [Fimbriimonas ginsengisoli]